MYISLTIQDYPFKDAKLLYRFADAASALRVRFLNYYLILHPTQCECDLLNAADSKVTQAGCERDSTAH